MSPVRAFAAGTIGIGLYLHDLPAPEAVERLVAQAVAAEGVGFDGASMAEHHAGFRSYLPNPLLAASWILAATDRIWSGPNPLLLPLRNAAVVAEDLAWLDARFPGRVGAGVAPGYHPDDFTALDVGSFDRRGSEYEVQLARITAVLGGRDDDPLAADHAVRALGDRHIPIVGAAGSARAARRAAAAGIGLLMDSMASPEELAAVAAVYSAAGGDGPRVLGRRIWVGEPPLELFEAQLAAYRSKADAGSFMQSVTTSALIGGSVDSIVERVVAAAQAAGASALALRIHLPGLDPAIADEQITTVGEELLPPLRRALANTSTSWEGP